MDLIYNTLRSIWHTVNALPPEVLSQFAQVAITALVASPLFLALKRVLIKDREKIMSLVVIFGSIFAGAAIFVATMPHTGVWAQYTTLIALIQGIATYAATQPVWIFIVKPLYARVVADWTAANIIRAQEDEIKTAAVPANGLTTDIK